MTDLEKKLSMSLEDLISSQKPAQKANLPRRELDRKRDWDRKRDRQSSAMDVETKKTIAKPRTRSPIRLARSPARQPREGRRIIKVSNIDPSVTWQDLKEAFSASGHVERCEVDGPIAIIIFRDHEGAKKAINAYDGGNLNGRKIRADFA